ncbi:MAG: GW dipeptide domain-containing protein, partial [Pisciglobus halotolerans]|nr:GW dipeptide domain-containing protein [Pisciglobus halotolerans]
MSVDGKEVGWIDKRALTNKEVILSEKDINYSAVIVRGTDSINTKPYGTEGYKTVARSKAYLNKGVKVTKEAVTDRATWALISIGRKELGWIDKAALDIEKIDSQKTVDYSRFIKRGTDNITSKPYGTEGYAVLSRSSQYLGEKVSVTKEATTKRATWALISINGKELGWIDKAGLSEAEVILSEKAINYTAIVQRGTDSINTKPYGTAGFKRIAKSSSYLNKQVKVAREAITPRATWALISVGNKELGWIDKAALDIEKVLSTKDVTDYAAVITRKSDSITSKPWGTEGYEVNAHSRNHLGAKVIVEQEATTRRATWALISLNGKELGWIDKRGLEKVSAIKKLVVVDAGHGGKDSGANRFGVYEKKLNMAVATKVERKLKQKGYEVVMTRKSDVFIGLNDRARMANNAKADLFVSIHTNAMGLGYDTSARGIETYSWRKGNTRPHNPIKSEDPKRLLNSTKLSGSVQRSLLAKTNAYNRKTKTANFAVLRNTWMPAILAEMGFVDNAGERAKLQTNAYQEKLA